MQDLYQPSHSPFDAAAIERLRRMGLATADGQADQDVMSVFATIFAGQLYNDLCGYYQDFKDVQELLSQLFDAAENAEPNRKFLLICLQYDHMYRDLPDPIWWISGSPVFSEPFANSFLSHLRRLYQTTLEGETP